MSIVNRSARAVFVLMLATGIGSLAAAPALADPLPAPTTESPIPPGNPHVEVPPAANYSFAYSEMQLGDEITMYEFGFTSPGGTVTRRIDWGDGSPVQVFTTGGTRNHEYAAAGVFHVSVELQTSTTTTGGTFPYGNEITIVPSVPPEVLSGKIRINPDHIKAGGKVTLEEFDFHGDDSAPVYIIRTVNWGDGTPHEVYTIFDQPKTHTYAQPGTYRVSVHLQNLQWHVDAQFPEGNTVTVTAAGGTTTPTSAPTTAPTTAPGDDGQGGGTGDGDDDGGTLPITGPGAGIAAGTGAGLLLAGIATLVALRRRRTRFVG